MKVTDLKGGEIQVTDLEKAIDLAEYFKDAHHIPPVESDKERQEYWNDIYKKLIELKRESNSITTGKNQNYENQRG